MEGRDFGKRALQHVKNYEKGQYSYFQLLTIKNVFQHGMKRAEGRNGRVERADGCKGWLKRAEGCKISGAGCSAPLFWSSWNTVIYI